MQINVSCNDLFEVEYIDENSEKHFEYFSQNLSGAKEFIRNSQNSGTSVSSVTYFIELMINGVTPNIAVQPNRRFSEHKFTPDEFLLLSPSWNEEVRRQSGAEIDAYMVEKYGVETMKTSINADKVLCDEVNCDVEAVEHLHYDFPNHDAEIVVSSHGIIVPFGGEKAGNFCTTHLLPKKRQAHVDSRLGLCRDHKCVDN